MNNLLKLFYILGKNLHTELSIRQLSIDADIPYTTTYRTIQQNQSLFNINHKSNSSFCSLNNKDPIVKHYLIIAERFQANKCREKNPQFTILQKELPKGQYTLILFGSRAQGTQRAKSDIDLCIINKAGKQSIDFSNFELLFNVDINPLFFTRREFLQMVRESEHNVAKEIIKHHIILYGEDYFWDLLWNDQLR